VANCYPCIQEKSTIGFLFHERQNLLLLWYFRIWVITTVELTVHWQGLSVDIFEVVNRCINR
jgi:hypothetical protein